MDRWPTSCFFIVIEDAADLQKQQRIGDTFKNKHLS